MASSFEIVARRYGLGEVARITTFNTLEYALVENDIGAMTLVLPDTGTWPATLTQRDTTLEIYRTDGAVTTLEGGKVWFIRRAKRLLSPTGEYLLQLTAYDARHLLKRRIVNYTAGSAQARKTGVTTDNMIRAIVRENMGASASAVRQFPGLSVEADVTYPNGGDTISKSFAWRNVLTVIKEIANQSGFQGGSTGILRYLSFDVIRTGDEAMLFQIFYDQRGVDRTATSSNPVVFSPETSSLADASLELVSEDEATVMRVGGPGEGADRLIALVTSSETSASAYNYIESFVDARNGGVTTAELEAEGDQQLYNMRARIMFTGRVVQTDALRYGINYGWGDVVVCQFRNVAISRCFIKNVLVRVTPDQGETIDIGFSRDATLLI